ncbi:hypothetical protein [Kribbella sp. CA-247076]|uniref:hypothetical protein n=1 Tax=Kribbella sp. CA-247076 TaxID=3239941 RepID=UPI003D8DA97B
MEWLLLVLGGGCTAAAGRYAWFRTARRRRSARELRTIRVAAEADAIRFGEELTRFGRSTTTHRLDARARDDYQRALDAYESAKRAVDRMSSAETVSVVVDTLASGRHALACVRARITGAPLPERRTPCFFDPYHGPSSTEVDWTPHNGPTRTVAACAQDAARVRADEDPTFDQGWYAEQRVPLCDVGSSLESYRMCFFASSFARAHVWELRSRIQGEGGGRWGNGFENPRRHRYYD